jgi:hypothetical protein
VYCRRPVFVPGSLHMEFVMDEVALRKVFLRVLLFSPVNIISPYHIACETNNSRAGDHSSEKSSHPSTWPCPQCRIKRCRGNGDMNQFELILKKSFVQPTVQTYFILKVRVRQMYAARFGSTPWPRREYCYLLRCSAHKRQHLQNYSVPIQSARECTRYVGCASDDNRVHPEGRALRGVASIVIKLGGDGIADVITLFDWVVAMVTSLNYVGRGNSCVTCSHYLVINMPSDKEKWACPTAELQIHNLRTEIINRRTMQLARGFYYLQTWHKSNTSHLARSNNRILTTFLIRPIKSCHSVLFSVVQMDVFQKISASTFCMHSSWPSLCASNRPPRDPCKSRSSLLCNAMNW